MSTLKAMIAQKTGVPDDLFGSMMGGKQLQTEERYRLGGIVKDTMITVTAGLRGGSPGAGTDTPSDASVDTLMDEVTGALVTAEQRRWPGGCQREVLKQTLPGALRTAPSWW